MKVTINEMELNLIKTNDEWGIYPGTSKLPILMRWNGDSWYFGSKETPAELKAVEEKLSLYIQMRDE